jgi:adenylate cyclase
LLRADAQAATRAKVFLDMGIGVEETVALMRAIMASLGHVAALMREAALKVVLRPGATELELAQESQELANRAAPHLGPMLDDLLRVEMRRAFEIGAVTAAERAAGELPGARDVTVGFADVVGFTRLGEALPPEQLHGVASLLAKLAREAAVAPVRFIKSIGDAVMFVSPEPAPLLNTVLDLAAAAAAHGLPPLRIGIASGTAVSRAGDWFGRPVNVASRVTATAPPGAVLVAESTHQAAADATGLRWFPHGARRLKGVSGDVRLFRVTRQSP